MVDMRRHELIGVRACGGCDAQELAVDYRGGRRLSGDLTGRSSGQRSDGCGWAMMSSGGGHMSSGKNEFLRKRNSKEGRE
jgi:hypothetical protein